MRQRQAIHPGVHPPESETEPEAQHLNGPVSEVRGDRFCTDCPCCMLFTVLTLCLIVLSAYSWAKGFPGRLTRGSDLYGDPCGFGDLPSYTVFLAPFSDMSATLCQPGCPAFASAEAFCVYDEDHTPLLDQRCFDSYASKPFYNRYCLPAEHRLRRKVISFLYDSERVVSRVVGDIVRVGVTQAWDILAIAGVASGAFLAVYTVGYRFPSMLHSGLIKSFLIASEVGAFCLLGGMCFLVYIETDRVEDKICKSFGPVEMVSCDEGDTADGYRSLCWVLTTVSILALSTVGCLYSSLKSSISTMQKSAKAARGSSALYIVLGVTVLIGTGVYTYFIVLLIYQSSIGETSSDDSAILPMETEQWSYAAGPRVLLFFSTLMALWCFSFIGHAMEFVAGGSVMLSVFKKPGDGPPAFAALRMLVTHCGSVMVVAAIMPTGRLFRNILLGLQKLEKRLGPRISIVFRICDSLYNRRFKYMTSDGLAYQTFIGKSIIPCFRDSNNLLSRHESNRHSQSLLNDANYYIWVSQLTITMVGPVLTAAWIHFGGETLRGVDTEEITSVTAMSFFALVFSWFLAQVYGGFVRGLIHGQVIAYLIDAEFNAASRVAPPSLREMMGEDVMPPPRKRQSLVQVEKPVAEERPIVHVEENEAPSASEASSSRHSAKDN